MVDRAASRIRASFAPLGVFIVLVLSSGSPNRAHATLIATESFDYRPGLLRGMNGGTGWRQAWFGDEQIAANMVSEAGLTYPGLKVSGRANLQEGNEVRTFRYLDTSRPEVAALVDDGPTGKACPSQSQGQFFLFLGGCGRSLFGSMISDHLDTIQGPGYLLSNTASLSGIAFVSRPIWDRVNRVTQACHLKRIALNSRPPNWPYRRFYRSPLSMPLDTSVGARSCARRSYC
jgi:hypothetical protein